MIDGIFKLVKVIQQLRKVIGLQTERVVQGLRHSFIQEEFEVKAKGFTGSESYIGNPFSAYRNLHIYIYSVCIDMEVGNKHMFSYL